MKTLIVICSLAVAAHIASGGVPVEWPVVSGGNGHYYEAVHEPGGISWTAASNAAVNAGGYLATVTSDAENNFVFAQVDEAKYWHQLPDPNNHGPWIGGYRTVVSGPFYWVTGEAFSYTAWFAGTGEPTGGWWLGQPELYIQYSSAKKTRAPTWNDLINDLPADYAVYGYVIEYDVNPSPIHYVDINNATPSDPYTSWVTAATSIQDAVDAASSNDTVLVEDGTYGENISVSRNMLISSVNGPEATIVDGGLGDSVFYLTASNCFVTGFTITNGYSWDAEGSGIYGGSASNCIIIGNYSDWLGGGMAYGTAYNCTFIDNFAGEGGGMAYGDAYNCVFSGNEAGDGGAMAYGKAYNCIFTNNSAVNGGGIYDGTAYSSILIKNTAEAWTSATSGNGGGGGGIAYGEAHNCTLVGNTAYGHSYWQSDPYGGYPVPVGGLGGGMFNSRAHNCTIIDNIAEQSNGMLDSEGGGVYETRAYNCIIRFNTADSYSDWSIDWLGTTSPDTYNHYSCVPAPAVLGVNNTDAEPLFIDKDAGNYRLATNSPCINAGNNTYVSTSTDFDGNPRIVDGTVDIGAYEFNFFGLITNSYTVDSGFTLEWIPSSGRTSMVKCSTNLVDTPFTNLSTALPYPVNIFTDTVYGAEGQCFYRVEMVP